MPEDSPDRSDEEKTDEVEISRRKFLKWSSYVPPAIAGLMVTSTPAHAATCNPIACDPECNPNANCNPDKTCPPDTGGCGPEGCPPNTR